MAEHTLGEWKSQLTSIVEACADGRTIARALDETTHPYIAEGITREEAKVNAHLIARAPDMFALLEQAIALRDLEEQHGDMVNWPQWFADARSALARARGGGEDR